MKTNVITRRYKQLKLVTNVNCLQNPMKSNILNVSWQKFWGNKIGIYSRSLVRWNLEKWFKSDDRFLRDFCGIPQGDNYNELKAKWYTQKKSNLWQRLGLSERNSKDDLGNLNFINCVDYY